MHTSAPVPPKSVLLWLGSLYLLVLAMVVVGGITRLTGSGLSMVVWQPLIGAIPPLSERDWLATFDAYQQTPQYLKVNHWMTVDDFKRIFLWEYLHRLLGRTVGVVTGLPWLYFVVRGQLRGRWAFSSALAFVLGGLQGALGWFMVQSGLTGVPAVSHLRLAAHLTLAFLVGQWLLWILLDARRPQLIGARGTPLSKAAWAVTALVLVQIVYGAFMAGTRAGYMYSTFPDMNGAYIASGSFALEPVWRNLFENPAAIHTVHRWLAWVVVLAVSAFVAWALRGGLARANGTAARGPLDNDARRALLFLLAAVLAQLTLGALTVLTHVNIVVAVLHQGVAYLLLSACVLVVHRVRKPRDTSR